MATETPFLKLRKAATSDLVDIRQDVVHNLDIIDRYAGEVLMEPWKEFRNPINGFPYKLIRCKYKVIGTLLLYQGNVSATGGATGAITINFPPGLQQPNTGTSGTSNAPGQIVGIAKAGTTATGPIYYSDTSDFTLKVGGNVSALTGHWNATVPLTWVSGSHMTFNIMAEVGISPNGL